MAVENDIVKNSIADLLADNGIEVNDDVDANTLTFKRTPSTITSYNSDVLEKCRRRADKVMTGLLKLYLSEGFINKSEYVQAKVNLDSMTLSKIMNQMEVSERAIQVLMDNIEQGDINSKLFDSLGNLQRTFIDLVRTQTNFITASEEDYRKIALDKDSEETIESTGEETTGNIKSSDPKTLINLIRNTVNESHKKS